MTGMLSSGHATAYIIMGKTPDLIVVQQTVIATLHKEDNLLKVIAAETGSSEFWIQTY